MGLVKGVEEGGGGGGGGGIDGSAVDFSWPPLSNGKGIRGTRWSPAGGSGGAQEEEKEGEGAV